MKSFRKLLSRAQRKPHHFVLVWLIVTQVVVLGVGGHNLLTERQQIIDRTHILTQNYADTIANRIEASIAKVDVLLSLVVKEHGLVHRQLPPQALTSLFEQALKSHPEFTAIMVVHRDGSLADYSLPMPAKRLNFSDRAYFKYHQTRPGRALHIGQPIRNRFDARMTVPISMRIDDPDGQFAGVVFVGLDVGYFEKEFATLNLGRQSTIAISHDDGTILFRNALIEQSIGTSIASWPLFHSLVLQQESGASQSVCPVDGITRIHAFRHLRRYPLIAFSGISQSDIEAEWAASLRLKLPLLIAVLLMLAASGLFVHRQLLREAGTRLRLRASLREAGRATSQAQVLNKALQKASDFQEAVLHSSSWGIVATDDSGTIVFVNKAVTKILGFPSDEVVGKMSPLVFHRTEDVRMALQRLRPGDSPFRRMVAHLDAHPGRQWQFIRKNGDTVAVSLSIATLKNRDGVLDGFVMIFQDLTELNRLEGLKSDFVSVVSHELRTPVTAIRGALSLHQAAVGDALSPSQRKMLTIATDNCDKLVRIVTDILDIDKLSHNKLTLHMTIEPVARLVERAISQTQPFATQYSVSYTLEHDPVEPGMGGLLVAADTDRFTQIMVNLLSNAAKFSHPDSEVTVSVHEVGEWAEIRVTDRGVGIAEVFRPHVFERFSQCSSAMTRKVGGTGLGLAITKMLVEAHGGNIDFHSEPGKGTTFIVRFPAAHDPSVVDAPAFLRA